MNKTFNLKRFGILLTNESLLTIQSLIPAAGAVYGVLLLFTVLLNHNGTSQNQLQFICGAILLIAGFIFTSMAFADLHQPQRGLFYITLPASLFEKFLSKLLVSSIGFLLVVFAATFLFSLLSFGLDQILWHVQSSIFNPFESISWKIAGGYLVLQSIFLFGAVYFKSAHLIKTVLTGIALSILLSTISAIFFHILFLKTGGISGSILNNQFNFNFDAGHASQVGNIFLKTVSTAVEFAFYYIVAPYFWILTYLRLKETEV